MAQRWKIYIEYDGTSFAGWQRQREEESVQQFLEEALQKFSSVETPLIYGSGRTDAGVHAYGQVAHFDLPSGICKNFSERNMVGAFNFYLQNPNIVVSKAERVSDDFHARFSARARHYLYQIINHPTPPAIARQYKWHIPQKLHLQNMEKAAQYLIGKHDFTSFRATCCQAKSPIRSLNSLDIVAKMTNGYHEISIYASAPSFLHHQVRNIVGTLVEVGKGKRAADDMVDILKAKSRAAAGQTAPATGLILTKVEYDMNPV